MCFICSLIGHDHKHCENKMEGVMNEFGKPAPLYGVWLKTKCPILDCFEVAKVQEEKDRKHIQNGEETCLAGEVDRLAISDEGKGFFGGIGNVSLAVSHGGSSMILEKVALGDVSVGMLFHVII